MSRISDTPPVGLRATRKGDVLVRVSWVAAGLLDVPGGWVVMPMREAAHLGVRAGLMGQADRSDPLPRGKRIALQRLAAQITARMLGAVEC